MSDKQYGHDDARDYEPYFSRHLMAMTAEDLHSKGEIACELAYRDQRIAELEAVAGAAANLTEACWGSLAVSGKAWLDMYDALRAAGYLK